MVDACDNATTRDQTITVVDTTGPVITGVGPATTIHCPATPVFSSPTASDACGTVTLAFADVTTPGASADTYSVMRTWTATDACANHSTASQVVTVASGGPTQVYSETFETDR